MDGKCLHDQRIKNSEARGAGRGGGGETETQMKDRVTHREGQTLHLRQASTDRGSHKQTVTE